MKLPENSASISCETQYQAAGWAATISAMGKIGERLIVRGVDIDTLPAQGSIMKRMCLIAFKDPSDIVPTVQQIIQRKRMPDESGHFLSLADATLIHTVDYTRGNVSKGLEFASQWYYEGDREAAITGKYVRQERFDADIEQASQFYFPLLEKALIENTSLAEKVKRVHHDASFYIGFYDPAINR